MSFPRALSAPAPQVSPQSFFAQLASVYLFQCVLSYVSISTLPPPQILDGASHILLVQVRKGESVSAMECLEICASTPEAVLAAFLHCALGHRLLLTAPPMSLSSLDSP